MNYNIFFKKYQISHKKSLDILVRRSLGNFHIKIPGYGCDNKFPQKILNFWSECSLRKINFVEIFASFRRRSFIEGYLKTF